jgi:hypothetical protein
LEILQAFYAAGGAAREGMIGGIPPVRIPTRTAPSNGCLPQSPDRCNGPVVGLP